VKGQHLTVDATTVQANASLGSFEEIIVPYNPEEYLDKVEQEHPAEEPPLANTGKTLSNETHISRTDPVRGYFGSSLRRLSWLVRTTC